MKKTVIFIANNPSHVDALEHIYNKFNTDNYFPLFITRDAYCEDHYKVEHLLIKKNIKYLVYDKYYYSSQESYNCSFIKYFKFKSDLYLFLKKINISLLFICNDDSALFERVVIEYCAKNEIISCLIQESVRPFKKEMSLSEKIRYQGVRELFYDYSFKIARFFNLGAYFRKGYGCSNCSYIFASGESYKKNLILNNVDDFKIIITGQPKFDKKLNRFYKIKNSKKTLLYCSQPINCKLKIINYFFIDFIKTLSLIENIKVIVKLHPRDYDESYWNGLIMRNCAAFDLEITKNKNLNACFDQADAFVTIASTTCLEAMMRKIPVALINYLPTDWYLPYNESVIMINDRNDLKKSLEVLLYDEVLRSNLNKFSQSTIYKEFYKQDGKSSQRIFDFCVNNFSKGK